MQISEHVLITRKPNTTW